VSRPLVIAHRGAAARETENSLAAFRAAGALGADAVELDVRASADGGFVVHHDADVAGLAIARASLAEVRERRLTSGEVVPTLEEALGAILPDLAAFVEVKELAERWDGPFLVSLDGSPAPHKVAVHAFDRELVGRLGRLRPGLSRGVLEERAPRDPVAEVRAAGADVLWLHWDRVTGPIVQALHEVGLRLFAWTVDDPHDMERLLRLGVDGLCTNHPERARQAVDSLPL
jgi:glycerophosphoryl diester phosphodiesterase